MPQGTKGCLIAAAIWIVILSALAVAAKFFLLPYFRKDLEDQTGSESRYRHEITLALDSFSGYAVLRSPALKEDLKLQGIKLTLQDDGADYAKRMAALDRHQVKLAVFTVDSFLRAGAPLPHYPGTIVMVIDETRGADAMVAWREAVPTLQDLNHPDARIVLTPCSPSEFLARTVIAHFNLPLLPARWWEEEAGAAAVFRKFSAADRKARKAYVLWEPYVGKALEIPGAQLLLDSSRLKGYIVDVLVADRDFLRDHPEQVQTFLASYFRAAWGYTRAETSLQQLVQEDATTTGSEALTEAQAKRLVDGILWKNTLENYLHFGLRPAPAGGSLPLLEDIIANIMEVLVKTGTLKSDPTGGQVNTLFYNKALKALRDADFHPGKKLGVVDGLGPGTAELDTVRAEAALKDLTEEEWARLVPVGEMRVPPLSFARGTARIHLQSQRDLDGLARKLKSWPTYYLVVEGHARAEGDAEANRELARERAQAAADTLVASGVALQRIKVEAREPSGPEDDAASVTFRLGQIPY